MSKSEVHKVILKKEGFPSLHRVVRADITVKLCYKVSTSNKEILTQVLFVKSFKK